MSYYRLVWMSYYQLLGSLLLLQEIRHRDSAEGVSLKLQALRFLLVAAAWPYSFLRVIRMSSENTALTALKSLLEQFEVGRCCASSLASDDISGWMTH